jgi:catalase
MSTSERDAVTNQLQKTGESIDEDRLLMTSNGAPVESLTASVTVGPKGDIVLKDFVLLDHLAAFDHERIPDRVVHAKGAGAHGYFQVTRDEFASYCKASLFRAVGKQTPVFVRFSTVRGEPGSADTVRDPRGFAIKFYTDGGNWDLVANNTPLFFIRDPILFPSFIHSQKRNPTTNCLDYDAFWDFLTLRPESVHQTTFLFSDRGIPDGFRHMDGFGGHTFTAVNMSDERCYVKFHLKTNQGIQNLSTEDGERIAGLDPDYAVRDLFNAIATDNFPSWTLYVQIMTVDQADQVPYDPFDITKV